MIGYSLFRILPGNVFLHYTTSGSAFGYLFYYFVLCDKEKLYGKYKRVEVEAEEDSKSEEEEKRVYIPSEEEKE